MVNPTTLEAAQNVHLTTRQSCLNCHAGAAGGDGTKLGDLSKEIEDPSVAIDMHMSTAGANLTCADCHNETLPDGTTHRVRLGVAWTFGRTTWQIGLPARTAAVTRIVPTATSATRTRTLTRANARTGKSGHSSDWSNTRSATVATMCHGNGL